MSDAVRNFDEMLYDIGYILAPIYIDFIRFVLDKSDRPALVLLRDGQPIYDIAQMLRDMPEFHRVAKWETRYLTRGMMRQFSRYPDRVVKKFLESENINGDTHVLVDTGYIGSIQRDLFTEYSIRTESVFMYYQGLFKESYPITGYWSSKDVLSAKKSFSVSAFGNFVNYGLEGIPKIESDNIRFDYNPFSEELKIVEPTPSNSREHKLYTKFLAGAQKFVTTAKKLDTGRQAVKNLVDNEFMEAIQDTVRNDSKAGDRVVRLRDRVRKDYDS